VIRPHQRRGAPVSLEPRLRDAFGLLVFSALGERGFREYAEPGPCDVIQQPPAREPRLREKRAVRGVRRRREKAAVEAGDQVLARHGAHLARCLLEQAPVARRRGAGSRSQMSRPMSLMVDVSRRTCALRSVS
jgi:hypothetical protein